MGVYRGDKPKNRQPPAKSSAPSGGGQAGLRQYDDELAALNRVRQQGGHDPLIDPSSPGGGSGNGHGSEDNEELPPDGDDGSLYQGQRGDNLSRSGGFYQGGGGAAATGGGLGQQALRLAKSQGGKRAALAASGFLGPGLILILLLSTFLSVLPTEQVAQAVIGVRFSRLHGQMAKRLNHTKETFRLWDQNPDIDIQELQNRPRRGRQPLVLRLLGVDDVKIDADLRQRGYQLKYERKLGVGPKRLVSISDKDGNRVFDTNDRSLRGINQLRTVSDDITGQNWRGRLLARRSVRLLAKDAGFRLVRLRTSLDTIRQKARGPPLRPHEVRQEVARESIRDKWRVSHRLRLMRIRIAGIFDTGEVDPDGRNGGLEPVGNDFADQSSDTVDQRGRLRKSKLIASFGNRAGFAGQLARKGLGTASIGILLATMLCTAYQVVNIIRDLAKLKIFQYMDTAASVLTSSSQAKAGNTDHAIVNNYSHLFEGFAGAATYQILHDGDSQRGYSFGEGLGSTIKEINQRFGIKSTFGALFGVLDGFVRGATTALRATVNALGWLVRKVVDQLGGIDAIIETACNIVLNPIAQIVVAVLLGLAEIGLAIFTGGVTVAIGAMVKAVLFAVVVEGVIRATNLEEAVLEHLGPEMVEIAAGTQSSLTGGPGPPQAGQTASGPLGGLVSSLTGMVRADSEEEGINHGVSNYFKVDYGAFYLSQAQALGEGGGAITVETAVAQDRAYLAQHRQSYTSRGVWDNIANPHNPYSLVARAGAWLPAQPLRAKPGQIRSATGWLAGRPAVWAGSVRADLASDEELAALLYPDQEANYTELEFRPGDEEIASKTTALPSSQVVGFEETEVNPPDNGEFGFAKNTNHVENKLYDENGDIDLSYRNQYGQCLAVDVGDFYLHQAGITKPPSSTTDILGDEDYYPKACQGEEARRYLIYYLDCQNVDTLDRINSNTSPLTPGNCDHLLPSGYLASIDEPEPGRPKYEGSGGYIIVTDDSNGCRYKVWGDYNNPDGPFPDLDEIGISLEDLFEGKTGSIENILDDVDIKSELIECPERGNQNGAESDQTAGWPAKILAAVKPEKGYSWGLA